MNNEELDSQLSAMFDGELPAPECELLARRLARDDALKARWGRYASIGAAIRMEPGVRLDSRLAQRVSAAVAGEPALLVGNSPASAGRLMGRSLVRWWQPVVGAGVAAGVAAAAILWLRGASPEAPVLAQSGAAPGASSVSSVSSVSPLPLATGSEPGDSYVVPPALEGTSVAPPTELADFVVAHSEFSTPLLRRDALAALVASEWARSSGGSRGESKAGSNRDVRDTHADPAR